MYVCMYICIYVHTYTLSEHVKQSRCRQDNLFYHKAAFICCLFWDCERQIKLGPLKIDEMQLGPDLGFKLVETFCQCQSVQFGLPWVFQTLEKAITFNLGYCNHRLAQGEAAVANALFKKYKFLIDIKILLIWFVPVSHIKTKKTL
jgi:hypothetical protein